MKRISLLFSLMMLSGILLSGQEQRKVPSFQEVLSLKSAGTPIISPGGDHVVFTVSQTDWKENRTDTEIWISKDGGKPCQLTNNPKSSSYNPQWSPDGKWIAFSSDRGNKNQIHVIRAYGGEAFPVTRVDAGVGGFEWSPDGKHIAFTMQEKEEKADKTRKERYGSYAVEDEEYRFTRLWMIEFNPEFLEFFPLPCY
jgi:dipeptidyl aminopeptidase/acylaminoacyl peptidase